MPGVNVEEEGAMAGCVSARGANQPQKHREWLGVGLYNGQAEMVHPLPPHKCCKA